jgi:sensor histidine kinase YesM
MEFKNTFKYHFLFGVIIVAMDVFRNYVTGGFDYFMENFTLGGILYKITFYATFFGVYAINFLIICPRTLPKKNLVGFALGQVSLIFIFAGIRYFIEEILVYNLTGYHNYGERTRRFWYYIFDNSYYSLKVILFSTFIYLLFMYLRNQQKIHELKLEQQKAELDVLKMQLEPHFIFNTLNVFYTELVETQPDTAKGIHKLSELLRHITYDAHKDFIPLQKELKFIEDYIYLYQKRFENNLYLDFHVEGDVQQQQIASLVLIHFVENIFKHGDINNPNHPVEITIKISEEKLVLQTNNKVSNVRNYSTNGIGRENLKKRLDLIYPNQYTYEYKETDNQYSSHLTIPFV